MISQNRLSRLSCLAGRAGISVSCSVVELGEQMAFVRLISRKGRRCSAAGQGMPLLNR